MCWFRSKWKAFVCIAFVVMLIGVLRGCTGNSPIEGTAVIIDFDYGVYSGDVRFRAVVFGYTVYGEEVVRRWPISSVQFQQLEIGNRVRRVNGRVIRLE